MAASPLAAQDTNDKWGFGEDPDNMGPMSSADPLVDDAPLVINVPPAVTTAFLAAKPTPVAKSHPRCLGLLLFLLNPLLAWNSTACAMILSPDYDTGRLGGSATKRLATFLVAKTLTSKFCVQIPLFAGLALVFSLF
jgi:hypothetical protein